jgi:hypothetical protein
MLAFSQRQCPLHIRYKAMNVTKTSLICEKKHFYTHPRQTRIQVGAMGTIVSGSEIEAQAYLN